MQPDAPASVRDLQKGLKQRERGEGEGEGLDNIETGVLAFGKLRCIRGRHGVACSVSSFWVGIATSQLRGHVHLGRYVCVVGSSSIEA